MKNIIKSSFLVAVIFAGCGHNSTNKNLNEISEVKTVEYYLQHDDERKETAKECNNNIGQIGETPNCVNSQEASWQKVKGKSSVNTHNNKSLLEGAR